MFIWKGALKTPQQNTPRIPMQILTPFLHWSKKSLNLSWYVFNEEEPWKPLNKILLVFPCRSPPSPLVNKIAQPCLVCFNQEGPWKRLNKILLVFPWRPPPPSLSIGLQNRSTLSSMFLIKRGLENTSTKFSSYSHADFPPPLSLHWSTKSLNLV